MLTSAIAYPIFERAINSYLKLDPFTLAKLTALDGKVIALELTDFGLKMHLIITPNKIHITDYHTGPIDTFIRGSSFNLFRMQFTDTAQLSMQDIELMGDVQTGQTLHRLLQTMEIDWEGHLANITGDIIAHQLGQGARTIKSWLKSTSQSLQENLTAYLQQEVCYLPTKPELENFYQDINELNNATARLEARLKLLNWISKDE